MFFAVPRNIARLTLGHGESRTIIHLSWPSPGQCDLCIFAMATDLSVDLPEDHDQRPSTILFEIIATGIQTSYLDFYRQKWKTQNGKGKPSIWTTFYQAG